MILFASYFLFTRRIDSLIRRSHTTSALASMQPAQSDTTVRHLNDRLATLKRDEQYSCWRSGMRTRSQVHERAVNLIYLREASNESVDMDTAQTALSHGIRGLSRLLLRASRPRDGRPSASSSPIDSTTGDTARPPLLVCAFPGAAMTTRAGPPREVFNDSRWSSGAHGEHHLVERRRALDGVVETSASPPGTRRRSSGRHARRGLLVRKRFGLRP